MLVENTSYDILAPNKKVEQKFIRFLDLIKPILEDIENNGESYVLLLPYSYKVEYNSNTSRYEYPVEYLIINNTQGVGSTFQSDGNHSNFINTIKNALKPSKKGYILVADYPLYKKLSQEQEFAQDIANGKLVVKSVYTLGLFHYIRKKITKDSIEPNVNIDNLCSSPYDNTKTFSRSKMKDDDDDWLLANRSSLSMAGLNRNSAHAVLTLPEEIVEGFTMFYGFPLNAPNVICKGAKQLVTKLLHVTSTYSNTMHNNDDARYYATTKSTTSNITIPKDLGPYMEIVHKVAGMVFVNTPKDMKSFLDLVNNEIVNDVKKIVDDYVNVINYGGYLISLMQDKKRINMLNDTQNKNSFLECINYICRFIEQDRQAGLEQIKWNITSLASNISGLFSIETGKYKEEALPLATLVYIYIRLIRYRDANRLKPKPDWEQIVTKTEHIITNEMKLDLRPPQLNASPLPNASLQPNAQQPSYVNNIYVLSAGRLIDCELFDSSNAYKYCQILLPQHLHDEIKKDPIITILDIANYICNFRGGIFSNVDQSYNLEVNEVPEVPISFNKYALTNLMLHTCDQREDAVKLLYRQAKIDIEAVANNIALDIINGQFKPNNNNEYFLNIIILKSKYAKVDLNELESLSKEFQNTVYERVKDMVFVLDDPDRDKVVNDTKNTYKFICNVNVVNEDDNNDLEKILRNNTEYCQNIVYMLDDHQYLHEMHMPLDEIQKYTITIPSQSHRGIKVPLTGYAHYVIAYALNYVNPMSPATDYYKPRTIYRVLMNSKSFSHDYARLLAYIYLLFNVQNITISYKNNTTKIDVELELRKINSAASTLRKISFSNKPYTVSLKAIQQFMNQVRSQTWYAYGFSRCNPVRKELFEEYHEISNNVYEGFLQSSDYQKHAQQIISACPEHASNAMDDNIGRVYVSILKPQEFSAINNVINKSTQNNLSYNMYFEKIRKYVDHVVSNIHKLYNKFSNKLNGYDTPEIDYNIETNLLKDAFKGKGKMDTKAKLRFIDNLEFDYVERIAYITSVYMINKLRTSFKSYANWVSVLDAVFSTDKLKTILSNQLEGLSEETYEKVDKLGKSLGLSNTEKVILILNYLYLNRIYSEQNQDIEETFRVLTDDLLVTNTSEASIYRTQILIAGIRMFLQNFICDLYSKSKGKEFMDANRFSGNYLIICEDSDIAAALASSLAVLLHFRSKTNKAMKEIELVAKQFYSNIFKTLYKRNTKWYNKIKDRIIGNSKNKYYDEELQFMDFTISAMEQALRNSESFINSNEFNSDYPLYGLSSLVFILSIPMAVSLAMSVGDKDSTYSMISMVYKYQDAMSAHGITLSNSYCEAGYEQPELELPEDVELSHITDFPVSTNVINKENIFDQNNYEDAITTISEVLTHRAKNMDQNYGQVIVTDDITRVGVDMSTVNTIIVLAGRRNTFSQNERQGTLILDKQVADSLYEQTGRKANVYYVTFEYDSRIDDMIQDSYLKPRFNTNVQSLYSVMSQVSQMTSASGKGTKRKPKQQSGPPVLTIAII